MQRVDLLTGIFLIHARSTALVIRHISLLEKPLEFDFVGQLPPPITEEVTQSLEETIKQRIRDENFDDVERKVASYAL